MIVNMPPEMVVRFRLLGYSTKRLEKWDGTFHAAKIQEWWDWLVMLEGDPGLLHRSLASYAEMDKEQE